MPPVPCSLATSPQHAYATAQRLSFAHFPPHRRSTPPTASPQAYPRARSLPLPARPGIPPAALRSLLTRSETPESLPEDRSAPKTQLSHLPATCPDPRPCTFSLRLCLQTDPPGNALPSTPAGSGTLALPPLPQRTAPPQLLSGQA